MKGSLQRRFVFTTSALVVTCLIAVGILVSSLFRANITAGFHDEMQIHIEELAALTALDQKGQPYLLRRLSDPRFVPVGTGFYWEVRRDGFLRLQSESLGGKDISGQFARTATRQWGIVDGPTGKTLEYGMVVAAKDGGPPIKLAIASDMRLLDEIITDLNRPLGWELALFAMFMIGMGILQVRYSMLPIKQLQTAVAGVRWGRSHQMDGEYPKEIAPLVEDMNSLLAANSEMVRSARVQAGNLAHGLRTPLAIMLDEIQLLEAKGDKASAKALAAECARMQRYINFYTAKARSSAKTPVPGQNCSLVKTIAPILPAMRRLHKRRKLNICIGDFPDFQIAVDEIELGEMISNLIDNACKWAKSRVIISWEADEANEMVVIMVDDDGPGIAEDERERVFQTGERLDEAAPGTGLGLSIVRDLATHFRGNVMILSSPLGGARIRLELPKFSVKVP